VTSLFSKCGSEIERNGSENEEDDFGVSHFDAKQSKHRAYGEYSNTTSQTLEFLIAGFSRVCLKLTFCGLNDFC